MKIILSETQYKLLKEYLDPVYFLKNKFSEKPKGIKNPEYIPYEEGFQKKVDIIFRLTKKENPIKHLNGYEVLKVTPTSEWDVLLRPKIDEWFNWKKNSKFKSQLNDFNNKFIQMSKDSGVGNPHNERNLPPKVNYHFWLD